MAICPHCSSILAVIPSLLDESDACPECDGNLVL
jgi:Zn-finger nucleic acid-binding protein